MGEEFEDDKMYCCYLSESGDSLYIDAMKTPKPDEVVSTHVERMAQQYWETHRFAGIRESYRDGYNAAMQSKSAHTTSNEPEDAVEFAEWVRARTPNNRGMDWWYMGSDSYRTTDQLYEIFKNENGK